MKFDTRSRVLLRKSGGREERKEEDILDIIIYFDFLQLTERELEDNQEEIRLILDWAESIQKGETIRVEIGECHQHKEST